MKREYIDSKKEIKDPDPIIEFTPKAWRKINYVIKKCNEEVGWLGSVEKVENEQNNPYHLRITDIWVPKQEVNGGTCEIKPEGRAALIEELFSSAATPQEGMQLTNSLRYWGHSHVNMGVFASSQDDTQILEMKGCPWYIRGIHNKKGDINLALYVFSENVVYRDLEPVILDELTPEEKELLDGQIKDNVKPKTYSGGGGNYSYYGYGSGYWYGGRQKSYDPDGFDSVIHFLDDNERNGGHHLMWVPDGKTGNLIRKRFKNSASYNEYKKKIDEEYCSIITRDNDDTSYFGSDEYYDDYYFGSSTSKSYQPQKNKKKKFSDDRTVIKTKKLDPITGEIVEETIVNQNEQPKQTEIDLGDVTVEPTTAPRVTEVWNKQTGRWESRIIT